MLTEKTTVSVFHFCLKGVFSDDGEEAYRSAKQQRCQIDRQLQQSKVSRLGPACICPKQDDEFDDQMHI